MNGNKSKRAVNALITKTVTIAVGAGTQVGVYPLHRGHHAVWAGVSYQVDVCNMVDDVVARDNNSGLIYRFPINNELLPWLEELVRVTGEFDQASENPWAEHNAMVRELLVDAAKRRLTGNPPQRNIFEPGLVAPAIFGHDDPIAVDEMLSQIIRARPEALVLD